MMDLITLGPKGTFCEKAAHIYYPDANLNLVETIPEIFSSLNKNQQKGLVPIKNVVSGYIDESLEGLIKQDFYIQSLVKTSVSYVVAQKRSGDPTSRLYTHPHAFLQCRGSLKGFEDIEIVYTNSNAESATYARQDPSSCALTSQRAAQLKELNIIQEGVKDEAKNDTHFGLISKELPKAGNILLLLVETSLTFDKLLILLDRTMLISATPHDPYTLLELKGSFKTDAFNKNLN